MIESGEAPPWRWLIGNAQQRRSAFTYWIRDTVVGLMELALYRLFRACPIDLCSWFGGAIVHVTRLKYRESEQRARKAWIALRPQEADQASVDKAIDRLWNCVSRTMAEFAVIDRFWAKGRITVEGHEHLARARAERRPILIAGLHLGNWEVVVAAGYAYGYVGSSIYVPPENRFEHRIAVEVRARFGAKSIAPGPSSGRDVLRALQDWGGPFVIFVDEFARDRVQAPAFGRPLRADNNIGYIVRIAAMCDAVVIPTYCVRVGKGARFKVTALPPLDMVRSGDRKADIIENIARLDAIIDPIIRAHLDQWYCVLDFDFES